MQLPEEVRRYLTPAPAMEPLIEDAYEISIAKVIRPYTELESARLGLVGIPFDTTTIFRRGSRWGPNEVRLALAGCTSYDPSTDIDIADGGKIADFGNVEVLQTEVDESWRRVETVMTGIFRTGITPVAVGGDHGLSYPVLRGLANAVEGRIGVIVIDAHYDVRVSHHGEVSSGVPFRYMIERLEGNRVEGRNVVEIGITGWHNAKIYRDWCREQGITVIPAREVHRRSIDDVIAQALEIAAEGTDAVWITLDIDAIDAAFAPGTNAPPSGGLTSPQVLELVFAMSQHPKVRGFDIMEVSPWYDPGGATTHLAASIILNFFAGHQLASSDRLQPATAATGTQQA